MRFFAVFGVALLLGLGHPAWAFTETLPGDDRWPDIPGRAGMAAFLGTWTPACNDGAYIENGDMTVHGDGRISYQARHPYLPPRYRVIEETPYYVLTLVRTALAKDGTFGLRFWAFRPLARGSFQDMSYIGIHECDVYGTDARFKEIWNSSDAELAEFWKTNKFCNPAFTEKFTISPYWGGRWGQACDYHRR